MNPQLTVKIDYLEFTIGLPDPVSMVETLIGLSLTEFKSLNRSQIPNYHETLVAEGLSIKLHLRYVEEDDIITSEICKIRCVMSGHGVDSFAKAQPMGWTWLDTISQLVELENCKLNRVDSAVDCINFGIPSVKKLRDVYRENQRIFSTSRTFTYMESGELNTSCDDLMGATLYIGKGDQVLRIYNKLIEQKAHYQLIPDDIKQWTRLELQLRNEKAQGFAELVVVKQSVQLATQSVLNGHYRFLYPKETKECRANKRNAWDFKPVKWWSRIISNVGTTRLVVTKPNVTLATKRNFINHQALPSFLQIYLFEKFEGYLFDVELDDATVGIYKPVLLKLFKYFNSSKENERRKYERFVETTKNLIVESFDSVVYADQQNVVKWVDDELVKMFDYIAD